jgi:hypothetical protein
LVRKMAEKLPTTPFLLGGVAGCATGSARPSSRRPSSHGGGLLSLYSDMYDARRLASGDEVPMNLWRSLQNLPSTPLGE